MIKYPDTEGLMFGYVAPVKETMDKQDFALFRAYYCGLCTNMTRLSRFALSYDCAFLAVVLDSCAKSTTEAKVRCPANPLKKVKVMQGDYVKYAADINTILAYHNICDNIHDGGGIKYKIARLLIKSAYKKAVQRRPEAGQLINTRLTSLGQLEKSHAQIQTWRRTSLRSCYGA